MIAEYGHIALIVALCLSVAQAIVPMAGSFDFFELGQLYYRKDRIKKIYTKLKLIEIKKSMGWCDDSNNKKYYNKLIKVNKKLKHEKLFRKDHKYDLLIPIEYNSKKRILGLGSCIFIHLTNGYKSTAGCIALKKKDFLIMIKLLEKKNKIRIC